MSSFAKVVDGVISNQDTSKTQEALAKKGKGTGSALGKDAFLQLLVAEMKYQDPMEAQNNSSEYIAQLATFSELESMQNLQTTAEDMKYDNLLGKSVIMNIDGTEVSGQVDNIFYEDGKLKLCVNGEYYDPEDLKYVVDGDYLKAYTKAGSIVASMKDLPEKPESASKEQLLNFEELAKTYYGMSDYEKSFLTDDMNKRMKDYIAMFEKVTGKSLDPNQALLDKLENHSASIEELLQKLVDDKEEKDDGDKSE